MPEIPRIKSVQPLPGLVLGIVFDDGRRVRFEPTEYLAGYAGYDVFSVAPGLFNQAGPAGASAGRNPCSFPLI